MLSSISSGLTVTIFAAIGVAVLLSAPGAQAFEYVAERLGNRSDFSDDQTHRYAAINNHDASLH